VADLAPVVRKLVPLIRLLSSDKAGERDAALGAIGRTLKSAGADFHDLAARVESNGGLTKEEMEKLYAAGFTDGMNAADDKRRDKNGFHPVEKMSPHEIAVWCRERDDRLNEREIEFLNNVSARTVWREPTPREEKWLRSIFLRLGGRV
jgi:hypothetical protein